MKHVTALIFIGLGLSVCIGTVVDAQVEGASGINPESDTKSDVNTQRLLKAFNPQGFSTFRKSLESLIRNRPHQIQRFRACLQKLSSYQSQYKTVLAGLNRGDRMALATLRQYHEMRRAALSCLLDAPLVFVKRHPYMAGHIYDDYLTWHPGGGIYLIENPWDPMDEQRVRTVIDAQSPISLGKGVYRDPELSWDGQRILFAFKGSPQGNTSLYEIHINGTWLRRITNPDRDCDCSQAPPGTIGHGHHDITPCYLPDGRIAFTSTRSAGLVMCFSSYIDILHTVNPDGSDLRCISVNNQNEFDPAVLPDGRLLYGRWEYVDKTALYMQSLWTVNPDGSNETALFANNLARPTAVLDARPVPGSNLIVAALTPHNGQAVGAIAMIDPDVGKNSLNAITNLTPEYATEMDQGLKFGPSDPWPLCADYVLIADNAKEHGPHGVIQLIDRHGTRVDIRREPDISCYAPMLVKPRKRPPSRPSLIRPGKPATFFVHDIYQGMPGIERGTIKHLRILETTSRVSGIPQGGRWWNQAFLASWQGSYDIKNYLGTVPVAADGSVYFEAPPAKALYFQALDENGHLIQSMRTFVQAVQGVTRSCVGCHVRDDDTAPANQRLHGAKLTRRPDRIRPEPWGRGFLDYPSRVQPILDKHCVSCHGGKRGMAGGIDLNGGWTWAFNISYETFIKNTLTGYLNCHNSAKSTADILAPRVHGSGAAPLTELLQSGHKGRIHLSPEEINLILAWMDGNCNYHGHWDYSPHATCESILKLRAPLVKQMKQAGCIQCHQEEIGNDWVNLMHPERSRILRAPLASDQPWGLDWCRRRSASRPAYPLITQKYQPPDVFKPRTRQRPDESGTLVTPFDSARHPAYQAMLAAIRNARNEALQQARVDMPDAEIIKGKCRDLEPLAPPQGLPGDKVTWQYDAN